MLKQQNINITEANTTQRKVVSSNQSFVCYRYYFPLDELAVVIVVVYESSSADTNVQSIKPSANHYLQLTHTQHQPHTSFAAPHVAGVVAELASIHKVYTSRNILLQQNIAHERANV
jgi:hypothetical protein